MVPVHLFLEGARAELSVLDAQREKLAHAIAAVERLHGEAAPAIAPVEATPAAPVPVIVDELHDRVVARDSVGETRLKALISAGTRGAASAKRDEARVVDLLAARGSLPLRAIADGLGLSREQAKYLVTKLRHAGTVAAEGETHTRVFSLAKPARRQASVDDDLEPVWDGSTKRSPAEVLQARREARA